MSIFRLIIYKTLENYMSSRRELANAIRALSMDA
ncbi:hypothetical protein BMETH_3108182280530, partial [methanotrophic bacterial endosymbiont of Bathymodiolus sp.]